MLNIEIQKLSHGKDVPLPNYGSENCSGLDLYAAIEKKIKIKNGEFITIPTGIKIALKKNLEAQIRPRSGLAIKNNISVLNTPGTIDSDYRGEIKVILYNHGNKEFIINNEDRIAQMVLVPIIKATFEDVENLQETIRGEGGFGSSGK